jgi:hypothetical protein
MTEMEEHSLNLLVPIARENLTDRHTFDSHWQVEVTKPIAVFPYASSSSFFPSDFESHVSAHNAQFSYPNASWRFSLLINTITALVS